MRQALSQFALTAGTLFACVAPSAQPTAWNGSVDACATGSAITQAQASTSPPGARGAEYERHRDVTTASGTLQRTAIFDTSAGRLPRTAILPPLAEGKAGAVPRAGQEVQHSIGEVAYGMSKDEVLTSLGSPAWRSEGDEKWHYGASEVQFHRGKALSIKNSGDLFVSRGVVVTPNDTPAAHRHTMSVRGFYADVLFPARRGPRRGDVGFDLQSSPIETRNAGQPWRAENGDVRGVDNDGDGRPEPIFVGRYRKEDGTYVRGHYRARLRN